MNTRIGSKVVTSKQGLLLKEAPEPRFELYCNFNEDPMKHSPCELIFETIIEYNNHLKEIHGINFGFIVELPLRPLRRFNFTQEELTNLKNRKCWCGTPRSEFKKGRNHWNSRFCSDEHYDDYWLRADNTAFHRRKFLRTCKRTCEMCGKKTTGYLEMDHIIALVLGGHPWDYRNLQGLCEDCHKIKTKSDVKILAWWKRESNYDIGPDNLIRQISLECYI